MRGRERASSFDGLQLVLCPILPLGFSSKRETANGRLLHYLFILKTNLSFADGVYVSLQRWRMVVQKTWVLQNFH